jgi:BirA family biotin operon repressor/biotin-[acetyl-CoA-carboxylase] ligase
VIGIGINVTLRESELPVPTAGSLALAGARTTDRDPLLRAVLRSLEEWYGRWRAAGGDPAAAGLQETYAAGSATLGRLVRADLPGDRSITGEAVAIDGDGRLVLATEEGVQEPVGAGDVVHLRPA